MNCKPSDCLSCREYCGDRNRRDGSVSASTPPTYTHTCECQGYHNGACTCEEGGSRKVPTYAQGQEETRKKIDAEIYRAVSNIAPNNVELLCILGSIGDSLSDEDVLECLEQYNERGTCVAEMIVSVDDTPNDRRARFKLVRALPIKEGGEHD